MGPAAPRAAGRAGVHGHPSCLWMCWVGATESRLKTSLGTLQKGNPDPGLPPARLAQDQQLPPKQQLEEQPDHHTHTNSAYKELAPCVPELEDVSVSFSYVT